MMRTIVVLSVIATVLALASEAWAQGVSAGALHRQYPMGKQIQRDMKGELGQRARETCAQQLGIENPPEDPAEFAAKYGAAAMAMYNDCIANTMYPAAKN